MYSAMHLDLTCGSLRNRVGTDNTDMLQRQSLKQSTAIGRNYVLRQLWSLSEPRLQFAMLLNLSS